MNNNKNFSKVISIVFGYKHINTCSKSYVMIYLEWLMSKREETIWTPQYLQGRMCSQPQGDQNIWIKHCSFLRMGTGLIFKFVTLYCS